MLNRRDFLRRLRACGLIGLAAASMPLPALAATPTPKPRPSPSPTSAPTTPPRPTSPPTPVPSPTPVPQFWVQALRPIPLWSGPDDQAEQFGVAARWDYFMIARPQAGPRLYVLVGRTKNYAWVDALSVGPSGPPPVGWPPADAATAPDDLSIGWVATVGDVPLWADADASIFLGLAPAYTAFKQVDVQAGTRLHVQDPYSGANAWLDAASVGPIGQPDQIGTPGRWWGVSYVDAANVRGDPSTRGSSLGLMPSGLPIVVSGWVAGEEVVPDNPTWASLGNAMYLRQSTLHVRSRYSGPDPTPPHVLQPTAI